MITETEIENADDFAALLDKIEELQSEVEVKDSMIEKIAGELTKALVEVVRLRK